MRFNFEALKKKLSSRKLWMALIGFAVAIGTAFGFPEMSEESVTLIATGCAALGAYVIGEGIADAGSKNE